MTANSTFVSHAGAMLYGSLWLESFGNGHCSALKNLKTMSLHLRISQIFSDKESLFTTQLNSVQFSSAHITLLPKQENITSILQAGGESGQLCMVSEYEYFLFFL